MPNQAGPSITEINASTGHLSGGAGPGIRFHQSCRHRHGWRPFWVANSGDCYCTGCFGYSVNETRPSTGALVRLISDSRFDIVNPVSITSDGQHVWIVNARGNSVTELNAGTGGLRRVISESRYDVQQPERNCFGRHTCVGNEQFRTVGDGIPGERIVVSCQFSVFSFQFQRAHSPGYRSRLGGRGRGVRRRQATGWESGG